MTPLTVAGSAIKVLHRAETDSSSDDGDEEQNDAAALLRAQLAVVQQRLERLEQSKASATTERKRLAGELRLERAGRERAEDVLRKKEQEIESLLVARRRLEGAFARSMEELRYWRGQHSAAARAAQTVLRELVVLRGHLGGLAAAGGLAATGAAGPPVPPANVTQELAEQVLPALPDAGASSTPQGSRESVRPQTSAQSAGQPAGCSAALLDEMAELRAAAADAEARAAALAQARERAEESEGLASMQAAALLGERAVLIRDLGSRDEAVRELRSCADALAHQLECALADRSLLLQQVSALAGIQRSADAAAALRAAIAAAGLEDDLAAALDGGGSEGNGGGGSVTDEQRAAERLAALEQELQDITAGASEASGA